MLNFADIANKKFNDIERPPNPPIGHYTFQITKIPEVNKSSDGLWETVVFPVFAVSAEDDVDTDDLKTYGNINNVRSLVRFMFDLNDKTKFEQTLFRLKTFLGDHVQCFEEGQSLTEGLNGSVNQRFIGELRWRPDKNNPEIIYVEIGKTMRA